MEAKAKLTCTENLSNPIVITQFTLRSSNEVRGTDTTMSCLSDLHGVGWSQSKHLDVRGEEHN